MEEYLLSKKNCYNCMIGKSININDDILCKYKGVVSRDYSCSKFKKMPVLHDLIKVNHCIECHFFDIRIPEQNASDSIGLCQLFSVRYFDGNAKRACSKFSKKVKLEVS